MKVHCNRNRFIIVISGIIHFSRTSVLYVIHFARSLNRKRRCARILHYFASTKQRSEHLFYIFLPHKMVLGSASLKGPHVSSCLYTTRITWAISLKHVLNMQFNMRTVCVCVCVSWKYMRNIRSLVGAGPNGTRVSRVTIFAMQMMRKHLVAVLFLCAS